MKLPLFWAALFFATAFSSCSKHDNEINDVEPPVPSETTPLAIAFAEGNSLQFDAGETKVVHYTITGGSGNTVVTAKLQNPDGAYTVDITPTSSTEGTIAITAKMPTTNNVIVSVSDGSQTIMATIAVSAKSGSQELAISFAEGNSLEFDVNETKTIHYTITGGSAKTVVKAELQKSDGAYTVATTPTSATEGTIAITAKTPETENCVIVTVSDGDRSITAEIAVSTNVIPEKDKLAIAFAEGNSLEFDVDETKIVHYTITGGSDKTVVTAELQHPDDAYAVETTPASATEGTIKITAKTPTENCVIVSVSDGTQSITAEIAVTLNAFDGKTAVVVTPGTLSQLLASYDTAKITELTVIGNLNNSDITTLKNLPNLAILDMEHVNLTFLPLSAFTNNKSLTSVNLPKILKTIGEYAFYHCYNLTSITIPNSVTTIKQFAFFDCYHLTNITIGNSVTTIESFAFSGCSSLTSITIPDSVTSIESTAFSGCSSLSAFYGRFASSDNRYLIVDGRLIAFAPAGLTSYTIPNSVTSIGNGAFSDCSGLTSITIPNSVTSIENGAFHSCHSLTSITIPNSVTTIESSAFHSCHSLTSITIPNSVTSIGNSAFDGCRSLTSIMIPDGVTSIGDYTFHDCSSLTSITIGNNVKTIGNSAFWYCSSLTSVMIPNGVASIGDSAFVGCRNLTSVTIPDSVTKIESSAFDGCSSLTSITIPSSVTSIGAWAFVSCSSLTAIYCKAQTPPSVGTDAFYYISATLYVPTGCKAAYAAAYGWKSFTIIETQF